MPGLTPADEVQLYLNQFPCEERLPQLALMERRATVGEDWEVVGAISAWRLERQLTYEQRLARMSPLTF